MKEAKHILVTGGTGYIGSHVCVALIEAGFIPVIVDDLSNSHETVVGRIEKITGIRPFFYCLDIRDSVALNDVFNRHDISAVIHLAAKKSVEESISKPLEYYQCNVEGLLSLLSVMQSHHITRLVYSSSATVYSPNQNGIYNEASPVAPINTYGWTKLIGEQIIADITDKALLQAGILRYFNPVGAHQSGLMGECPKGTPNNLMPIVAEVIQGKRQYITVYGDDYETPDGTAIRDFIHIMDVANAHISVLHHIFNHQKSLTLNIGTGKGYSVFDIIRAYEDVNQVKIPIQIGARRGGDAGHVCADVQRAKQELAWEAKYDLNDMCRHLHMWTINEMAA